MGTIGEALFNQNTQSVIVEEYMNEVMSHAEKGGNSCLWGVEENKLPASRGKQIAVFLGWVLSNNVSPVMRTYTVLFSLYLSREVRRKVFEASRLDHAHAYFQNFEARFEKYVCGIPETKKTRAIYAKTPTEIVLNEWILFTKISHAHR